MSTQSATSMEREAARFEALYRLHEDPWHFGSSTYEQMRYGTVLQGLRRAHYASAFEVGCSVGVFTAMLAPRCGHLLAVDVAPTAVAQARRRCGDLPQVELCVADVRAMRLEASVDLILLNEVGYYFDPAVLARLGRALSASLSIGGEFVASHWLGHSVDHALHGDEVHRLLQRVLPLRHVATARCRGFRMDTWLRDGPAQ